MPAPIIEGIGTFLQAQLNVNWTDGEVPRYDVSGNPINQFAGSTSPVDWPITRILMNESGFTRTSTFFDPYDDEGNGFLLQIYGTSRGQTEPLADRIELLFAPASNWPLITLGGVYYVISMNLFNWTSVQVEGERTSQGELLYRYDMHYALRIHGAVPTS